MPTNENGPACTGAVPRDYDFFGYKPADWHEDLVWVLWCRTAPKDWTTDAQREVAELLVGGFTVAHELKVEVSANTMWLRAQWIGDARSHGDAFFRAVESTIDAIHAVVGLERAIHITALDVLDGEKDHWSALGRWPDFGEGPINDPSDWLVEGLALENRLKPTEFSALEEPAAACRQLQEQRARDLAAAEGTLAFLPCPEPTWLHRGTDHGCTGMATFHPTEAGGVGLRGRGEGPWWKLPKEIVFVSNGVVSTIDCDAREKLSDLVVSPSGARAMFTRTRPGSRMDIVEFRSGVSQPEVAIAVAPDFVDPTRRVYAAAYLDSDDWVAVLASPCLPKGVDSLELWRRTDRGFVRVDDVRCGGVEVFGSHGCAVVPQDGGKLRVFGRVGNGLVSLGNVPLPAEARILRSGPNNELVATDLKTTHFELANHDVLRGKKAHRVPKGSVPLAELQADGIMPTIPDSVPEGWSAAYVASGQTWAVFEDMLVVATADDADMFDTPADPRFRWWSVASDGQHAVFNMKSEGICEFDLTTQTWSTFLVAEDARPFYVQPDTAPLIALSTKDHTTLYRRAAGELERVAELPVGSWPLGAHTLLGADGHLYKVAAQRDSISVTQGSRVRLPGRRLKDIAPTGLIENGIGYVFAQTDVRRRGVYCWIADTPGVVGFG